MNFYYLLYSLPLHHTGSARNEELRDSKKGLNSERSQLFWPKDQEKRPLETREYGEKSLREENIIRESLILYRNQ